MKLTTVPGKVPEGYIVYVEELPEANTQGGLLKKPRRIVFLPKGLLRNLRM